MGERKEEDLYHNFSRKDFQGLCKKYGLPANKSNSEMATSLILYLEKKNLSSRAIWEGTRSDCFASGMRELQAGVKLNSTDDQRKDCVQTASHKGSGNYRHHNHRDSQQNDLKKCKGSAASDKASEDVGKLTQLCRESNSGAGIQENTFSSVVSSSAVASYPTLTYDVYCEDGIQLCVDLNSSSSDWVENLKAGVHLCHHVHRPNSPSYHQDIGLLCSNQVNGSVIMDPSKEDDNGELIQAQTDEPDKLNNLSDAFNSLENSKELAILSLKLDSGTQDKLPDIESSGRGETLVADSGSNEVMQTGLCSDSKGIFVPSVPKCSDMQVDPGASTGYGFYENPSLQQINGSLDSVPKCSDLFTTVCAEMQTSTCATFSNVENSPSGIHRCEDLTNELKNSEVEKSVQTLVRVELQTQPVQTVDQSRSIPSSSLVNNHSLDLYDVKTKVEPQQGLASFLRKTEGQINKAQADSAENAGFCGTQEAGRGTGEEQKKDAALCSCCNGGAMDLVVSEKNGGDQCNSTEINEDVYRIPLAADVGKLGIKDPGNGSEELKSFNHEDQLGIPCKRPACSESNAELKKKRHNNGVEGQSKFVNAEAKFLRSSKQFVGDVHSKCRRSSRLFTK